MAESKRSSKNTTDSLPNGNNWPTNLAVLTGLFLISYLCFMVVFQYKEHVHFNALNQKRVIMATQRLKTTLEFFFDSCRREVLFLADHALKENDADQPQTAPSIKATADGLIQNRKIGQTRLFRRVCITDNKGRPLFDTRNQPLQPSLADDIVDSASSNTAEAAVYAHADEIIIAAAVLRDNHTVGHVMVWLDIATIKRQFLVNRYSGGYTNNLISDHGVVYYPDRLPNGFETCIAQKIGAIAPQTLLRIDGDCGRMNPALENYLSIKLPVARTPLAVFSILPTSDIHQIQTWQHAMILGVLTLTFFALFAIQMRISRRNNDLRIQFTQATQKHAAMVASHDKLAEEIILRKQAEAELKIINEHLEDIARYRTSKLEDAMNDLRDTQSQLIQTGKLASIGELAAGIAHELNQPLMVIRGNTQLMARMIKKSPNAEEKVPAFLETVERNTKRMIMIIDHLRSFARQSNTEMQSVDIHQVIDDAFLMIGEQLRLRNIETIINREKDLPSLKGDPYQLEQVVLNMLSNARDAIEAYHPDDKPFKQAKQIRIATRLQNGSDQSVVILFTDTGCGITQEDKEKIFDPFFTTKAVGKGTGLGLSITYGILQEHNGALEIVETRPGLTTFKVVLPVRKP